MEASEPREPARPGIAAALAAGAAWGWLVGAALAVAEWILLAGRSAGYGFGGPLPLSLLAASFGELFWSQVLLWTPATALVTAARAATGRRDPAPFAASFAMLAGSAFTIAAHGAFEAHLGRLEVIAVLVIATVATVGVRRLTARAALARAALVASALLGAAGFAALLHSPLYDPGSVAPPAADASAPEPGGADSEAPEPGGAGADADTPRRPHVLWIVLDTARADRTSLLDAPRDTTPFLARFGAGAHVFDAAVSDGTWTSPSHASMFTGLPVRAHGVGRTAVQLSTRFETVAETLAHAGWATASFSNNPLIGSGSGLSRGFETRRIPSRLSALGASAAEIWIHRFGIRPPLPFWNRDHGAAVTNRLVADWLDARRDPARPVFVFVNYMEAHLPWEIPEAYRESFLEGERADRSRALRYQAYGDLERALNQRVAREGPGFLAPGDREVLVDLYDGTLRYLDARVAELLGLFEARGLLDDTLV
ncbi:MAG TPA: sulfatase-like hydrolase/transferase, partial [Myxococcota bacterium]|nr:sulfatase-like hydrolase/transferase [Myxococcota bacterium]